MVMTGWQVARRGFTLIELLIVLLIISIIAVIAIPNLLEARKNGNEVSAIGAMKTIANAEIMYQQHDNEQNGQFDYGNLQQLSNTTLIDPTLAAAKHGYRFDAGASSFTPDYLWFATANPVVPWSTGDRYFCTNFRGQILYTIRRSIAVDTVGCSSPSDMLPVR